MLVAHLEKNQIVIDLDVHDKTLAHDPLEREQPLASDVRDEM